MTFSVVSMTGQKTPPTFPPSAWIGLYENEKYASSG